MSRLCTFQQHLDANERMVLGIANRTRNDGQSLLLGILRAKPQRPGRQQECKEDMRAMRSAKTYVHVMEIRQETLVRIDFSGGAKAVQSGR